MAKTAKPKFVWCGINKRLNKSDASEFGPQTKVTQIIFGQSIILRAAMIILFIFNGQAGTCEP